MEHSQLHLQRDGAGGQRMKKDFGVLPKWKKPTIKPDYYIDDFSNNYGQAEPADIDGKPRTRLPVDSTPASAVCCGGGYVDGEREGSGGRHRRRE